MNPCSYSSDGDWGDMLDDQGPEFWEHVCWPADELIEHDHNDVSPDDQEDPFYAYAYEVVYKKDDSTEEHAPPLALQQSSDAKQERLEQNLADWQHWAQLDHFASEPSPVDIENHCQGSSPLAASADRREQILAWLQTSDLARPFRSRNGFFIRGGSTVTLLNGRELDAILWLFSEGIIGGARVGGYEIVYNDAKSPWGESLSFFPCRVPAPF